MIIHYHIGGNISLTVRSDNPCVDLRKYWKSENEENLVPTKKGICLHPAEYITLKSHVSTLEKEVPQLETILHCFMRDDHQNQLVMLRCATCNPLEYIIGEIPQLETILLCSTKSACELELQNHLTVKSMRISFYMRNKRMYVYKMYYIKFIYIKTKYLLCQNNIQLLTGFEDNSSFV